MSGAFNSPRHKRRPSINITSLIDVMFLLLIFFMVSSTFKQHAGIDVALPKSENASTQDVSSHEIIVDKSGRFYLDGEHVGAPELRTGLVQLLDEGDDGIFVLRADAEANFGKVLRAIDIARDVGGDRLIIPTDLLVAPSDPTPVP